MKSTHLLVANWKMNYAPSKASSYCKELVVAMPPLTRTSVWIAPPDVSLAAASNALNGSAIKYGAQNVHWAESGAFTGETSPVFLKEIGATFAIVGHSERRTLFGETSELTAKRAAAALEAGITPIVCIGETEEEQASGLTEKAILAQMEPLFQVFDATSAARVVLAYEPVWAIGTGKSATSDDISSVHSYIGAQWSKRFGDAPVTLYGGSVNPSNFESILARPEVHGALVGGASLKLDQWIGLVKIAELSPIAA